MQNFNDAGTEFLFNDLNCQFSTAGAIRNMMSSLQYTMISSAEKVIIGDNKAAGKLENSPTADVMEALAEPSDNDESVAYDPRESLRLSASIYYGLLQWVSDKKISKYEANKSLLEALAEYKPIPRGTKTSELFEAVSLFEGEAADAGVITSEKELEKTQARKPDIARLLAETRATITPNIDAFTDLPIHKQVTLMAKTWQSLYWARAQKMQYSAGYSVKENVGELALINADLGLIRDWCHQFEDLHADELEALLDTNISFTLVDDVIAQVSATVNRKRTERGLSPVKLKVA